jgi:hypothetical protein
MRELVDEIASILEKGGCTLRARVEMAPKLQRVRKSDLITGGKMILMLPFVN